MVPYAGACVLLTHAQLLILNKTRTFISQCCILYMVCLCCLFWRIWSCFVNIFRSWCTSQSLENCRKCFRCFYSRKLLEGGTQVTAEIISSLIVSKVHSEYSGGLVGFFKPQDYHTTYTNGPLQASQNIVRGLLMAEGGRLAWQLASILK